MDNKIEPPSTDDNAVLSENHQMLTPGAEYSPGLLTSTAAQYGPGIGIPASALPEAYAASLTHYGYTALHPKAMQLLGSALANLSGRTDFAEVAKDTGLEDANAAAREFKGLLNQLNIELHVSTDGTLGGTPMLFVPPLRCSGSLSSSCHSPQYTNEQLLAAVGEDGSWLHPDPKRAAKWRVLIMEAAYPARKLEELRKWAWMMGV